VRRLVGQTFLKVTFAGSQCLRLGADKAYVHELVDDLCELNITPHVAQNATNRSSASDARAARHVGYASVSRSAGANRRAVRLGQDNRRARLADAARRRALEIRQPTTSSG
jgi:hypothetical protein